MKNEKKRRSTDTSLDRHVAENFILFSVNQIGKLDNNEEYGMVWYEMI